MNGNAFLIMMASGVVHVSSQTLADSEKLITDLMNGYNKLLRPALNYTDVLDVNVSFGMTSIRGFNEEDGSVEVSGGFMIAWNDVRLKWDTKQYNGLNSVILPITSVWVPDLIVTNSVTKYSTLTSDWDYVYYYSNGLGIWYPVHVFQIACAVNIKYYPFDTQTVFLGMFLNRYPVTEVRIHATKELSARTAMVKNGEWEIIETEESAFNDNYALFQVKYVIARRWGFVFVILILPVLIMGILNILVFLLPAASGERMSYNITILLSLAIFMTIVSDNIPKTSSPLSILCYFIGSQILMSFGICVATILNLRLFHIEENKPVSSHVCCLCRRFRISYTNSRNARTSPFNSSGANLETLSTDQALCMDTSVQVCNGRNLGNSENFKTNKGEDYHSVTRKDISLKVDRLLFIVSFIYFVGSCVVFSLLFVYKDDSERKDYFWNQ